MTSRRKNRNKKIHTSLKEHKQVDSHLEGLFSKMNMQPLDWQKDILPEHLWIGGLAEEYGIDEVHKTFNDFMDVFDSYFPEEGNALGLITDFGLMPLEIRDKFCNDNETIIYDLFYKPIGRILSFYPDNPASWLINKVSNDTFINPEIELKKLRAIVYKLFKGKDYYTGHIRLLPFSRIIKHGKLHVPYGMPVVELLSKYPHECNEDQKSQVQFLARTTVNLIFMMNDLYTNSEWQKYFWRHNYDLSVCKPFFFKARESKPLKEDDLSKLNSILEQNIAILELYVNDLVNKIKIDLYEPQKEEIFFGLFSRIIRLYCLIAEDFNLWAKDTSGIMLRCLTDVAITFCYLALEGTDGDFKKFIEYGEGQEKLLMLHLQDNYPDSSTIEGLDYENISDEIGQFNIEMLDIELKSWTKKDARKLAIEAKMEKFYRLVYSPSSADIHGTWHSLKNTNLCSCGEILHRFHRLPFLYQPPIYINTFIIDQEIINHCINIAQTSLGYPELKESLNTFNIE